MNVDELRARFSDEQACRQFLESVIWPNGRVCPHCSFRKPSDIGAGRLINISMGGLSFDYHTSQALPIEATELDIFLTDSPVRVSDVLCRSIWDLKTYENPRLLFTRGNVACCLAS